MANNNPLLTIMNVSTKLLAAAAKARPAGAANARWLHLVPVVQQLQRNGFQLRPAVRWLKDQGEITAAQEASVYRSLRQHFKRNGISAPIQTHPSPSA